MKRRIALILCLTLAFMSAAVFLSCSGEGKPASPIDSEAVSTEAETTADPLADNLPERSFGGYEFRFYTCLDAGSLYVPEAENGDVVNDAAYSRNRMVEERFDIRFVPVDSGAADTSKHTAAIKTSILAGGEDFDIIINNGKSLASHTSMDGLLCNLHSLGYFDYEKPWWSKQFVDDMTFNGIMYVCSNNLHYEEFAASKVYYFNKGEIASRGIEDPYKTVFAGVWTLDHMISLTKDVYEDINGNGSSDKDDFYGLLTTVSHNTWSVALDIPEWEKKDGAIEFVALSEKMFTAFDKIHDWDFNSKGLYTWPSYSAAVKNEEMRTMFINGRGIFTFGFVGDSGKYYRETEVDYGIVPFPKFDENQESYRIFYGANSSNMFGIPVTLTDTERTGIIVEALAAESYKQLQPAYYEVALKAKYLRDEDSVAMLDLVTSCRTISFSYCYDNWNAGVGFGNCFGTDKKDNYTSFVASREALINERLNAVAEVFTAK